MGAARTLPPYAGDEPYLYLCAAGADQKRIRPLLMRLFRRGVRVWYLDGSAKSQEEHLRIHNRIRGASLVVVYLSEAFRADIDVKSRALACQSRGQKLLCLNTDGGDRGLSIGLHPDTPTLQLKSATPEEIEDALLRADGFTQELIGKPGNVGPDWVRVLTITLTVLAVLVLGGALAYAFLRPHEDPVESPSVDTVTFADATLNEAVQAVVGGPVTEDALQGITELSFSALPDDLSELAQLPNLTRIVLTQGAAIDAAEQVRELTDTYEIVLNGGGGS